MKLLLNNLNETLTPKDHEFLSAFASIVRKNGTLYLYYTYDGEPHRHLIGVATSTDNGKTWTRHNGNALILTLTGVRKQDIFLILIPIGVAGAFFMVALGKWQYTFKRSFYKKDAETEAQNNPYIQAQNRLLVDIAKKTGIDTTDFEKRWIK